MTKINLALAESIYIPSLTINSDFQINQREKTSYSGAVYTVDMWKLHAETGKLVVNDGYVTLTGTALKQHIPLNKFEKKSYTQVVKLKDETAKVFHYNDFDGTYKELTVDGLKCALEYSTTNKVLTFYIWNKSGAINIEYGDLFEGSIAYEHQKEDYATAYNRCRRKVKKLDGTLALNYRYNNGQASFIGRIFFDEMDEVPIATGTLVAGYNDGGSMVTTQKFSNETQVFKNVMVVFPLFTQNIQSGTSLWINTILSCEPLP